jgi:hypothetical protein
VDEDGAAETPEGSESEEEKDEFDVNPLFLKSHDGLADKKTVNGEVEEEAFSPNIGDEVRINGQDGIVKVVHGPNDTTGVMIDGQTTMVKKAQVKRVKNQEAVNESSMMGMSPMIDLRRMQELAGLKGASSPLGAGRVPVDINAQEGPQEPQDAVEVTVEPMPAPEAVAAPVAAPAPTPAPAPAASLPELSIDGVMTSFDQIEAALPNIALADAKTVRERINAIMAILNEGLDGRKRKI